MRKREEVKEMREVIAFHETDIICNKCGNKMTDGELNGEQFQYIPVSFGYGSRFDNESWGFDLCEDCLEEFVKTFEYVPEGFGEDHYCAAHPQTMFEEWKTTGIVDLEAGMTKEEVEERGGSIYVDVEEDE